MGGHRSRPYDAEVYFYVVQAETFMEASSDPRTKESCYSASYIATLNSKPSNV